MQMTLRPALYALAFGGAMIAAMPANAARWEHGGGGARSEQRSEPRQESRPSFSQPDRGSRPSFERQNTERPRFERSNTTEQRPSFSRENFRQNRDNGGDRARVERPDRGSLGDRRAEFSRRDFGRQERPNRDSFRQPRDNNRGNADWQRRDRGNDRDRSGWRDRGRNDDRAGRDRSSRGSRDSNRFGNGWQRPPSDLRAGQRPSRGGIHWGDRRRGGGDHHRFAQRDYRHFSSFERNLWRGGRWHHGHHHGRNGWWWIAAGSWYFYDQPLYPYPGYVSSYYYDDDSDNGDYWYYCRDPEGYYPYVQYCNVDWEPVPADYDGGGYGDDYYDDRY